MSAVMHGGTRRYGADSRAFNYAIVGSILLHGLLLFALPALRESSKRPEAPPGPIVARLAQPRAAPSQPAAPAPQAEPQPAPQVQEPPPSPVAKQAPVSKPAPVAKSAPTKSSPIAPTPPTPSAPAAGQASSVPAPPSAAAPAVAKAEPQPAASAPSAELPDAGTLAQYRLQLITVARKYKRYPRVAMDNNWEGTVEIRMVIGANGMIASLVIRKGTGHDVLDQEAIQWIRKAKPLAAIPAALRGKEFTIDIPVVFNLKEPDAS
jgi:protein TonB